MTSPELVAQRSAMPNHDRQHGTASYHPVFELAELIVTTTGCLTVAASSAGAGSKEALLDAYLCAASICQVVSDHAHRDTGDLLRVAGYASRLPGPAGKAAAGLLRGAAAGGHALTAVTERQLARWLCEMEGFTGELADALWRDDLAGDPEILRARWAVLVAGAPRLPSRAVAVPPRCFFTFDQRPEDCVELAARLAARHPDRNHRVLVVGVRTSGCFLAPIVASALRHLGFELVDWTSWRPGRPTLQGDLTRLRRLASEAGRALIVDDPPTSGGSLARTASELVAAGLDRSHVTLLLPLFPGKRGWEPELGRWEAIELAWEDWGFNRRLENGSVANDLRDLLPGTQVLQRLGTGRPAMRASVASVKGVTRLEPAAWNGTAHSTPARRHVRVAYRVELGAGDGSSFEHDVLVQGCGLGMFGRRAASVAARLDGLVPQVYGVTDGLLYQELMPGRLALDESEPGQRDLLAQGLASYAAQRAAALPVASDAYLQGSGHDALWEQASRWLGEGFGRLALPLRPFLHASGRRLLQTRRASLIDASMGEGRWFADGQKVLKADWDEGAFVYQVPFCYDAAFDVAAAAAARLPDERFGEVARREFETATHAPIEDVRWFLYQLLSELDRQAWVRREPRASGQPGAQMVEVVTEGERCVATLHRAFLSRAYLAGVKLAPRGELVAIDVDGVLESARWSYPTPSAEGLVAVRALLAHGFRPVIATGRSLDESIRRCRDYGLAGAVSEYGSAVYDADRDRIEVLIGDRGQADLEALRSALTRQPGVALDFGFRHAVRAFVITRGRRRAIPDETAQLAIAAAGLEGRVRTFGGWAQTDFVAEGMDKGGGLRALARLLGAEGDPPLALAVGDSAPDLPMFELARVAAAPANADPALASSGWRRSKHAYGRGLAEAVAMVVGHAPGTCPECAAPSVEGDDKQLVLALLRVADRSGLRKLAAIAEALRL
jgi:hydroxymethylpyrimidine pyrophosphatase-like HAD family hydrolase